MSCFFYSSFFLGDDMENMFVLKLVDGEDIILGLKKLAEEKSIDYGFLVSASGSIKDFELVSIESRGGMSRNLFREECDVVSVSGKIGKVDGKPEINMRVSISSTGFTSNSGQLLKGKAAGTLEIGVRKVNMKNIIGA